MAPPEVRQPYASTVRLWDARQQAELDALPQSNFWTRRSVTARLGLLPLVVTPTVLVVGILSSLATAHWLVVTACLTLFVLLVLSPYVFAPAWFIRANFGAWSVSDAAAATWKGPGLP